MVKVNPRITVSEIDFIVFLYSPNSIAWCAHVTETPDDTSKIVFKNGIPLGSKQIIPEGGHEFPSSTAGDSAKCKYAQNIPKKKKHSDKMKTIIPALKPSVASELWSPS